MRNTQVVSRYATSLIDEAESLNILTKVIEDSETFLKACYENRELRVFIKSPVISHRKKLQVLEKVFSNAFHNLTLSFIKLITTHKREDIIIDIFLEVVSIYKRKNSIVDAEVVTAVEINEETIKTMESFILKLTGGKQVDIRNKVDENIIGGFALKFNDKLYDASIATKLRLMKKQLVN
jgi:F-type H+-transporting ATPase subunit delta